MPIEHSPTRKSDSQERKEPQTHEIRQTESRIMEAREPQPSGSGLMSYQYVSIKDALEAIPMYDGHNIPLSHFIEGCEEARDMLPPAAEDSLSRIVRNKLKGDARRAICGLQFNKIGELIEYLKMLYAPVETVYQVQGKLGSVYQKEHEDVISYANRVRDLGKRVLSAYTNEHGTVTKVFRDSTDESIKLSFIRGLKPDIESRIPSVHTFSEAIATAIRIEKENLSRTALRPSQPTGRINTTGRSYRAAVNHVQSEGIICQLCSKHGHTASKCWWLHGKPKDLAGPSPHNRKEAPTSQQTHTKTREVAYVPQTTRETQASQPVNEPKVCRYCKIPGHIINECRKRAYNNALKEKQQSQGNSQIFSETGATRGETTSSHPVLTITPDEQQSDQQQ